MIRKKHMYKLSPVNHCIRNWFGTHSTLETWTDSISSEFCFFRELTCECMELPVDNVNHINKLEIVWNICVRFFYRWLFVRLIQWNLFIITQQAQKTKPHTAHSTQHRNMTSKKNFTFIFHVPFFVFKFFFWFCSTFIVLSRAFQFEFQRKFAWAQWFSVSKRAR